MESGVVILGIDLPVWILILLAFFLTFVITGVSIPTIVRVSSQKKLYDFPNERTSHEKSVPTLGGMSIFAAFIISVILFSETDNSLELRYLLGGMIILFFAGLKDDILIIDPKKKFISQVLAALLVVILGDIRITSFHSVMGIESISYLSSVFFTVLFIVGLINGFNLIDGVDGLASGIGIINTIILGIWFFIGNQISYAVFAFSLAGSLLAYFLFNVFGKENKIFMGDTGSMLTGFIVSILAIKFLETENVITHMSTFSSAPLFCLGLLIVPIFDTLRIIILRLFNGKSPFQADRNHIHHNLLKLGLNHIQVTLVLISVTVVFAVIASLLQPADSIWLIATYLAVATAMSLIVSYKGKVKQG